MRFDPEDYAFIAHYDPTRLANQAKGLSKQGFIRIATLVISIIVIVIIARNANGLHPTVWNYVTRWTAIFVLASLVLILVAQVVESVASEAKSVDLHVAMVAVVIVAANLLLYPVYLLVSVIDDYLATLRNFVVILDGAGIQSAIDTVQPLVNGVRDAKVALIVILIVGGLLLVASIVLLVAWLMTPRSLGWVQRRLLNIVVLYPLAVLLLCGGAVVLVSQYVVPQLNKKLSLDNLPPAATLPATGVFADWLIWVLMAGLMVTAVMLIGSVAKTAQAKILLVRVPAGNALRVDALGVVHDDLRGPDRIEWTAAPVITGRQRGVLPGPELVIARPGQPGWSVPLLYLDVMAGTIDSAIRAATMNNRTLDLTPLDKVL